VIFATTAYLSACALAPAPGNLSPSEAETGEQHLGESTSESDDSVADDVTPHPEMLISADFATPWPKQFTRDTQTNTALAKSYAFFDSNASAVGVGPRLTMALQSTVPAEYEGSLAEAGEVLLGAFSPYAQQEHHLFIGSSVDWLIEQAEKRGVELPNSYDRSGTKSTEFDQWGPNAFPNGEPSGWAHKNMAWVGYSTLNTNEGLQYIVSHELFHSVHLSLDGHQFFKVFPDGDERNVPKWFVEGTASYFGWSVRSWATGQPYYSPTPTDDRYGMPICPADFSGLESFESWYSPNTAYTYGQIAIEYIIASKDVSDVMQVFENMGTGQSFGDAFENALGLTDTEFYEIFDRDVVPKSPATSQC